MSLENIMTEQQRTQEQQVDDFYVGYLPTPASHRSMLRVLVPALVLVAGAVATLVAITQRDPGRAVWDDAVTEHAGIVLARPSPMLITRDDDGTAHASLLVLEGKHGAASVVGEWHGREVIVSGREITREGRRVIEVVSGGVRERTAGSSPLGIDPNRLIVQGSNPASLVTMRGEIIDSKCYHGAMKPGEGKGHKACATLCIRNGIPAMFAVWSERSGPPALHLLLVEGGEIDSDTLSKIGERVEVSGHAGLIADMRVLTIEPGSVRRVTK
jgi:hypothetical protein